MTTKPTHTHRRNGGRFAELSNYDGGGALEGQKLVVYRDLDHEVQSVTTMEDWRQHWREVDADDCPVCLGAGHDQIKGNRGKPCGGCYGLGRVKEDGETPQDRWELSEVALGIIQRQQQELEERRRAMTQPEVREALHHAQMARASAATDAVAEQERQWREGPGRGPGGRRMTGD